MQKILTLLRRSCAAAGLAGLAAAAPCAYAGEPYKPARDSIVLERLPWRADGEAARLASLRLAASARPGDATAAVDLARHAFLLATAHGDSRWAGMGEAALRPWWDRPDAPPDVLLMRALLKQYRHAFDAALSDLGLALKAAPTRADIRTWRVAIHLVHADIEAARVDCEALSLTSQRQELRECRAWIAGHSGDAQGAYAEFRRLAALAPESAGARRWLFAQLADNALRLGRVADAETHLRDALALPGPDHAALIALADLLLDHGRAREALVLLGAEHQSDAALLRRSLARRKLGDPGWREEAERLQERQRAARARGEALRESDEARLRLELFDQPAAALALAQSNWRIQRESADARILLEAALAAKTPQAARPVLEWLERTRVQEPRLIELARTLRPGG